MNSNWQFASVDRNGNIIAIGETRTDLRKKLGIKNKNHLYDSRYWAKDEHYIAINRWTGERRELKNGKEIFLCQSRSRRKRFGGSKIPKRVSGEVQNRCK